MDIVGFISKNAPLLISFCGFLLLLIRFFFFLRDRVIPFGGYRIKEYQSILSNSKNVINDKEYKISECILRENLMRYFTGNVEKDKRSEMIFICMNTDIQFMSLKKVCSIIDIKHGRFVLRPTVGYNIFKTLSWFVAFVMVVGAISSVGMIIIDCIMKNYIYLVIHYACLFIFIVAAVYCFIEYPNQSVIDKMNLKLSAIDPNKYYESGFFD